RFRARRRVRDEAEPVSGLAETAYRIGRTRQRLTGDVQDAVHVEQNRGHERRLYSRHAFSRLAPGRGGAAGLPFERAGWAARAEVRDAGRRGLRRRGVERAKRRAEATSELARRTGAAGRGAGRAEPGAQPRARAR